jgi:DNA ligase-4
MLKFRVPLAGQQSSGDFGEAVYRSLKERLPQRTDITIAQVNVFLDRLATAVDKEARREVLKQLLHSTSASMQKWLVRIILKDLKIGVSEKSLLKFLHPDALGQYNVHSNLRKVCDELTDRSVRSEDRMVQLLNSVKPKLAAVMHMVEEVMDEFKGDHFVIETKFDGNRVQVHRQGKTIAYFGRNGVNHSEYYGPTMDRYLFECVLGDNYIIDGELMAWLPDQNRYGKFK